MIQKAYKTEIDPNNKQKTLLLKHAGCARGAWNWALGCIKNAESKPTIGQLRKKLTELKKGEFAYMNEVAANATQESLRDLEKAFTNFLKKRAKYPKFKSRDRGIGSFRVYRIKVTDNKVHLPILKWVNLKEKGYIPTDQRIVSATVSEKAGRWYVSVLVEEEIEQHDTDGVIGVDLGIKTLATCSDGSQYANPKALSKEEARIKHFQRKLSRKTKGSNHKTKDSNRRTKLKKKIARLHQRVTNIRKDATHKITSEIVKIKRPQIIVLEDLNVSGMTKNHRLAKAVCDANMRECRRQFEYKAEWTGVEVRFVDRFFPSSKMCSVCGTLKQDLKLGDRTYKCSECGLIMDRDLNAAHNLKNTVSSTGINAHGEDVEPRIKRVLKNESKIPSVRRELTLVEMTQ